MTLNHLIDFAAGIVAGAMCARCYYITKAHRRRMRFLPRRVVLLNRERL